MSNITVARRQALQSRAMQVRYMFLSGATICVNAVEMCRLSATITNLLDVTAVTIAFQIYLNFYDNCVIN